MISRKRRDNLVMGKFRPDSAAGKIVTLLTKVAPKPVKISRIEAIDENVNMRGRVRAVGRVLREEKKGVIAIDEDRDTVRLLQKRAA